MPRACTTQTWTISSDGGERRRICRRICRHARLCLCRIVRLRPTVSATLVQGVGSALGSNAPPPTSAPRPAHSISRSFTSPNCMREILRAVVMKKPMFSLVEPEAKHGGLAFAEVRQQLDDNDARGFYDKC
eukprot:7386144-Prymnesium_polylepis.1